MGSRIPTISKEEYLQRLYEAALKANQFLTKENRFLLSKIRRLEKQIYDLGFHN